MDWLTVMGWLAGPVATALIAWLGASLRAARRREREREERTCDDRIGGTD